MKKSGHDRCCGADATARGSGDFFYCRDRVDEKYLGLGASGVHIQTASVDFLFFFFFYDTSELFYFFVPPDAAQSESTWML
jgi:hypothetical protein